MPLQPTARVSLVDQAIEAITRLLAAGEWPVGHRIPPEPELAASLGVSRNTVREAVRALAHVGVLDVRRGDGTFVVRAVRDVPVGEEVLISYGRGRGVAATSFVRARGLNQKRRLFNRAGTIAVCFLRSGGCCFFHGHGERDRRLELSKPCFIVEP